MRTLLKGRLLKSMKVLTFRVRLNAQDTTLLVGQKWMSRIILVHMHLKMSPVQCFCTMTQKQDLLLIQSIRMWPSKWLQMKMSLPKYLLRSGKKKKSQLIMQ